MRRSSLVLVTVSLSVWAVAGCRTQGGIVVGAASPPGGTVYVESAPPAERTEARPESPSSEHLWIRGHWQWEGRWVWREGHWELHRPRQHWVEGHWIHARRGHYWEAGHWER
jgi:hypothetical protein